MELGEGVFAVCRVSVTSKSSSVQSEAAATPKADLSSLSSMLQARWKGGASAGGASSPKSEEVREGQIRSFRISRIDPSAKKIDLELV